MGLRWVLTARDGGARLSEQPPLSSRPTLADGALLTVATSRGFQTLEGFGGAFTEAAATVTNGTRQTHSASAAATI